ncbi:TetR family transcriptional regulator C-terminal domain-containing protein [Ruegeria marisrubri]|uniref:TetR/AcrR family transcriptional regulator n=1 Tax=Ruegeria marisrubri TaxID=1685379 RepID=UPI001CD436FB|nr:TetR family transcriptional regulator C-terminal domain-containing protein [Ruegeria marisrubri]MCA0905684.1 TetR family transcriptional regulator C-terminal domain-containing protein [Ruegeria marisrubri]
MDDTDVQDDSRKFKRESAEFRREALILATLDLIAEMGVRGATVREIAARANVTQGLIRHYFSSKDELVQAAYEHHMNTLTDQTAASSGTGSAVSQLTNFVDASLRPPIVDPSAVALWAGFLNKVQHDPKMQRIHQRTYDYFRDHLEKLIVAALQETGRSVDASEAMRLAIACNAVIDGLWLEGGALPDAFSEGQLARIGLDSVSAIVGIPLTKEVEQS